jgi:ribonuclease P/MRP protein subunit POP7
MTHTPPCGQAAPTSKEADTDSVGSNKARAKAPRIKAAPYNTPNPRTYNAATATRNTNASPTDLASLNAASKRAYHKSRNELKNKRPRLPPNATISKRPLLHPAIPTPFASSEQPKVLYITRTSPFIPTCKRIRSLLTQIAKRATQSTNENRGRGARNKGRGRLEANGSLSAQDVEASIAAEAGRKGKSAGVGVGSEEVYLKATGRAIPRALELGVKFQGEEDCRVRVEMGSIKAIDDIELTPSSEEKGEGEGEQGVEEEEEVPETRIRTLSTVTVCIGLV